MRAREFIHQQEVNEIAPVVSALARGTGQTVKKVGQLAGQAAGAVVNKMTGQQSTTAPQPTGNIKTVGSVGTQQQQATQQTPQQNIRQSAQQNTQQTPDQAAQTTAQQQQQTTQQQQKQQQQSLQQRQQTLTNLDKIAAQLVALKQDLTKQQQA